MWARDGLFDRKKMNACNNQVPAASCMSSLKHWTLKLLRAPESIWYPKRTKKCWLCCYEALWSKAWVKRDNSRRNDRYHLPFRWLLSRNKYSFGTATFVTSAVVHAERPPCDVFVEPARIRHQRWKPCILKMFDSIFCRVKLLLDPELVTV